MRKKTFLFLTFYVILFLVSLVSFPFLNSSPSFYPVSSAATGQFKWLLTGSAGDLWLHLSLTWNPLPSDLSLFSLLLQLTSSSYTYSILHPFIILLGRSLSVLSLLWDIIFFFFFLLHLSNAPSLCFCLQNKLRTGG